MTNQIQTATEMLTGITDYLNRIITTTGKAIDINNTELWNRYFHSWTNQDWDVMLTALEQIQKTQPSSFESWHKRNIQAARAAWHTQSSSADRILDTKRHKAKAWACVMTIREVVNHIQGVDIPNKDSTVQITIGPKETVFGRLFYY